MTWRQIVRAIGVLAAISVFMQMAFSSIYAYLPLYLTDSRGVSPEIAAFAISLVAGVGVVGAPLGGSLSDRLGRKRVILLSLALAGPLLLAMTRAPAGIWLMLSLVAYGVVITARMPAMESLVADEVPPRQRATVLGTYYLVGQESAGVATPLVGRLVDLTGIHPVFTGLAVGFCLVSATVVAFRKRI
jgi:FSR family fosmidomycin resistance protein-like MFS transporter